MKRTNRFVIVELYQRQTGNRVEIVGSPCGALLTRITNSLTAPESEFDIVILDEVWANQFYEGELVASLTRLLKARLRLRNVSAMDPKKA